jgi:serine/threonine protein kinase
MWGRGGLSGVDEQRANGPAASTRFLIKERLGVGGMGVVYRAFDQEQQHEVAIKFLSRLDGDSLYRFKKEFRALADLSHPNLVSLHELLSLGDEWCFTMDLVDGKRFDDFLGVAHEPGEAGPTRATVTAFETPPPGDLAGYAITPSGPRLADASDPGPEPAGAAEPAHVGRPEGQAIPERLWQVLAQLVEGLQALHRAGKLHRDIKPSNVLVTHSGKVVLCDFGLVAEVHTPAAERRPEHTVVGTPFYMSPEQAAGQPLSEATDWYSVGVMLYQSLTGQLPFGGDAAKVLWQKRSADPPAARLLNPRLSRELEALCMALLRRDPATRAGGRDILSFLGRRAAAPSIAMGDTGRRMPFVGRTREQDELRAALAATRGGHSVSVLVLGLSGMGKSSLVRRFLDQVRAEERAVVLAGRCYEREQMPYKALDTVVDALSTHLLGLPPEEVAAVLPADMTALTRLFPVLRRVRGVAGQEPRAADSPDPHESRRRALAALRHVLKRLGEQRPVVLFIDDLQWGDLDSAPFLVDLVHHADAPPVLLVTAVRREDADASPLLRLLRDPPLAAGAAPGDLREIALGPLTPEEAEALGRRALPRQERDQPGRSSRIAEESGGSPLFVLELARAGTQSSTPVPGLRLEQVVLKRVLALSPPARALVTAVAVSGRPTPLPVLAASLGGAIEPALVHQLRTERLVRGRASGADSLLEPYHDRIREAVVAQLPVTERQAVHRSLALAHEQLPDPDPQTLAEHWDGAGDREKTGRYALLAAARAEEAFAFHRAVTYLELALRSGTRSPAELRAIKARLALALAHVGRLADAADLSLEAAEGAEPDEALELRRRALEANLFAGRLQEGLASADDIARAVGLSVPRSPAAALFAVAWGRLAVRARGTRFHERPAAEIDAAELRRLDVCWSLANGISFVDPMRGMAFQARHLREALHAGEPYRVSLALSLEIPYRCMSGSKGWHRVEPLLAPALERAERTGHPQAIAFCYSCTALAHFVNGHWRLALDLWLKAERIWRDHGTEMRSTTNVMQVYIIAALIQLGETRDLPMMLDRYLQEAKERGDHYATGALKAWRANAVWLLADKPDLARRMALEAPVAAMRHGFHLHHMQELLSHSLIDLYQGDMEEAWQRMEQQYPKLWRSALFRIQPVRMEARLMRACCAVGRAAEMARSGAPGGRERERLRAAMLKLAARVAAQIDAEKVDWGSALALGLRGCIAAARGDLATAAPLMKRGSERLEELGMMLFARVGRRRYGEALGGAEGAAIVAEATAALRAQGIGAPEKVVRMYAPGFPEPANGPT